MVAMSASAWPARTSAAAGMVSAQLEVSVAEALIRLRAYAFAHEGLLSEVAAAVVAREPSSE